VTVFPEPASDDNVRRSRRIAEIKIKEQFIPTTQYDDIDIPLKSPKKKDKAGKKGATPSKKVHSFILMYAKNIVLITYLSLSLKMLKNLMMKMKKILFLKSLRKRRGKENLIP